MLNIGIENIQPKVSTETEMSIEELIDFVTAVVYYSDEINQDFKVLDQHILAVENLISVLDNLKEHGVTPAIEALIGNQIELSEASLENMITAAFKKFVEFLKLLIERIKKFFTKSDSAISKLADEIIQIKPETAEVDRVTLDNEEFAVSVVHAAIKNSDHRDMLTKIADACELSSKCTQCIASGSDDEASELHRQFTQVHKSILPALELESGKYTIAECKRMATDIKELLVLRKHFLRYIEGIYQDIKNIKDSIDTSQLRLQIRCLESVIETMTKRFAWSLLSIRRAFHRSKYFTPGDKTTEDDRLKDLDKSNGYVSSGMNADGSMPKQ